MVLQTEKLKDKTNEETPLPLYTESGELSIKQELVMRYLYIVKQLPHRCGGCDAGSLQMEDIINEGVIAIMKGIDRYDAERDNKFETFISRRIRGMIIDLVRKNDWMPRDFRKQVRMMEDARIALGGDATDEEIAKHIGMDIKIQKAPAHECHYECAFPGYDSG